MPGEKTATPVVNFGPVLSSTNMTDLSQRVGRKKKKRRQGAIITAPHATQEQVGRRKGS